MERTEVFEHGFRLIGVGPSLGSKLVFLGGATRLPQFPPFVGVRQLKLRMMHSDEKMRAISCKTDNFAGNRLVDPAHTPIRSPMSTVREVFETMEYGPAPEP